MRFVIKQNPHRHYFGFELQHGSDIFGVLAVSTFQYTEKQGLIKTIELIRRLAAHAEIQDPNPPELVRDWVYWHGGTMRLPDPGWTP